jgi:hypothetical protein
VRFTESITTVSRDSPPKAAFSTWEQFAGSVTVVKLAPKKALSLMRSTVLGKVTDFKDEHPMQKYSGITFVFEGNTKDSSELHEWKILVPRLSMVLGIVMDLRPVHP